MAIGTRINKLRKQQGRTLQELADKTGSSKSYIWELENKSIRPGADKLSKIADVLGTTADYLLSKTTPMDAEAQRVLDDYLSLTGKDKYLVREFIRLIKRSNK